MGSKNGFTKAFSDHKDLILLITVIFMAVSTISVAAFYAFKYNPDYDSYFLIETGRYIVTNHKLPETAYWLITEDVPTIIQQWLCCVVNYAFYSWNGFMGIKILGLLMIAVLYGSLYLFASEFTKQKSFAMGLSLSAIIICNLWVSTTRPYALTITLSVLLMIVLKRFFASDKHSTKEIILFYLKVAGIFVFQANWQISNIIFPTLWICCFIPKLKDGK